VARAVEITAVNRRLTCDNKGRARIVFTATNTGDQDVKTMLAVEALGTTDPQWFSFHTEQTVHLDHGTTTQIILDVQMPVGTDLGIYKLRILGNDDAGQFLGRSVTVAVSVVQQVLEISSITDAAISDGKANGGRSKWTIGAFFAKLFGSLCGLIQKPFRGVFRWILGGNSTVEVVDIWMIIRAMIVLVAVMGLSQVNANVLSLSDPPNGCENSATQAVSESCLEDYWIHKRFFQNPGDRTDPGQEKPKRSGLCRLSDRCLDSLGIDL